MSSDKIKIFQNKVYDYYHKNKRDFSWRNHICPYRVFISEVMLQQTQTSRVIPKFEQWLARFPSFQSVAQASVHDVLIAWQGLGYNRRALALQKACQIIVNDFSGVLPDDVHLLQTLPGIGPNTAGSVSAFAFNKPTVFVETNIRTVFLYEFFQGVEAVDDKQILDLVAQAVDHHNTRDWYYALMDYGVFLKKELKINNKTSRHYSRQSRFSGSFRQLRGAVVRILTKVKKISHDDLVVCLAHEVADNNHSLDRVLQQLQCEGFIKNKQDTYFL